MRYSLLISDGAIGRVTGPDLALPPDVASCGFAGVTLDGSPMAVLLRKNSDFYSLDLGLPWPATSFLCRIVKRSGLDAWVAHQDSLFNFAAFPFPETPLKYRPDKSGHYLSCSYQRKKRERQKNLTTPRWLR
jgi:hypothetical protein